MTSEGRVPFSPAEEAEADQRAIEWTNGALDRRLAELAALRYEKETAGIMINGILVRTDRESQATISGMYNAVQIDPDRIIRFKGSNGWVELDTAAVTTVASAVANHVQACFARESELADALATDINTDISGGWPV